MPIQHVHCLLQSPCGPGPEHVVVYSACGNLLLGCTVQPPPSLSDRSIPTLPSLAPNACQALVLAS